MKTILITFVSYKKCKIKQNHLFVFLILTKKIKILHSFIIKLNFECLEQLSDLNLSTFCLTTNNCLATVNLLSPSSTFLLKI